MDNDDGDGDGDGDDKKKIRTIKCAFNSILVKEHAEQLQRIFFERSVRMTKISSLASLLLLHRINTAIDEENEHFFEGNGKKLIENVFRAVVTGTDEHARLENNFRITVERSQEHFQWPTKGSIKERVGGRITFPDLGNSFGYFHQMYQTNLIRNLTFHCETRLKYFLRMKCYYLNLDGGNFDATDIRNALKAVLKNQDWTDNNALRREKMDILRKEIEDLGFPANCVYLKSYIKINWLRSILIFAVLQREVEEFIETRVQQWHRFNRNNIRPNIPKPPTVNNFTVIPLCRFKLKHTRFDHKDMYDVASVMKLLPRTKSTVTNRYSCKPRSYYKTRASELWALFFDMQKINRMDKHNDFHWQMVTDGVAVSVLYHEPVKKNNNNSSAPTTVKSNNNSSTTTTVKNVELRMTEADFLTNKYVIGIDPNDKTFLGVVRRDIISGQEVSTVFLCD